MGKIVRKPFRDCTWNLLFEILMRNIYVLEVLNLAPGGLLSILKFDMGAYSKGGGIFEGRELTKEVLLYMVAYSKRHVFCIL